ncbi:lipopolysaccharide biosynthesis protein [Halomarina salina]|uniref:Lipopolysaccharide biosynthesis protein n=1 Tax=Halomarina salina TaxID=1872699 RepID=A0ABD5RH41_9EURY|nr:lipopolysaccharide biosynthesis protein [Halomarina salina]
MIDRLRSLVRHLVPSGGTAQRVTKGTVWVMSQNVFGRLLQLGMLAVLARLIGPSEIGLVGIALLVLSATKKFTEIGLEAAIIQQEADDVDHYLNTTWVLQVLRGVLIAAVLYVAAPFVADVFDEARATVLVRAIGLSPLLFGLTNPGIVYFQKNLEFHKDFVYKLSGEVGMVVIAVAYALFVEQTAWAYVVGYVAADAIRLVISYLIHPFRPGVEVDRDAARDLIGYGKWITGSSVLYFLYSQGDDAFVAAFIGPAALAFYQYAYRFSNAPATELTQVVSSVLFPMFSKLQSDMDLLKETFLKSLRLTTFVALPMSCGIAIVAPSFVVAFLGEQWVEMVVPMQILTVYGLFRSLGKTWGPVWKATGRPDYHTKLSLVRVTLLAILIYPLTDAYGITGTALAVTSISLFPMIPLELYLIKNSIDVRYREIASEISYPLVASGLMSAGLVVFNTSVSLPPLLEFLALSVLGVALYGVSVLVLELTFDWGIRGNLESIAANLSD